MEHKQFILAMNQICDEKGIPKEKALEIVEAALAAAYKKEYGKKGEIIQVEFDEKTGDMKVFQIKIVAEKNEEESEKEKKDKEKSDVSKKIKKKPKQEETGTGQEEKFLKKKFNPDRNFTIEEARKYKDNPQIDDEIRISLPPRADFGRIAAQTAKQVMIQKIREAEKEAIFDEFKDKEGEVANGIVQRVEGRNVYIDVGRAVGVLRPSEQIEGEFYRVGQRLKVYIINIEKEMKDAVLSLSRTNAEIIKKLFELEVPEIAAKTVEIKSIAREAGSRTKVAVYSHESGVDPVGSCVGQRGSRIQTIISELGGEKIDIIEWNKDHKKYIQHALSPAKVSRIEVNEENKVAAAYVNEDQLSLAIGKQGQNVRLAAKLTGWRIDVLEEKKDDKKEEADKAGNKHSKDGKEEIKEEKIGKNKERKENKGIEKSDKKKEEKAEKKKSDNAVKKNE